jgi:hypothetical protein
MKSMMMQCAPCCDAVFGVSDNEVLYEKLPQSTSSSVQIDTTQLSTELQLNRTASAYIYEKDLMLSGSESQPNSPGQRIHRHSRRLHALIDLFINDEVVSLNLETLTLPCAYEVEIPFDEIERQARRYSGLTELRFSLYVRHCNFGARNLFLSLRFPSGTTHYLGPLAQHSVISSGRFVSEVPRSVTLVVDVDGCIPRELEAPLPCEMLLKEHVKTILENDDFCGSIAAAHVQNLVRDLPFYDSGMRRFKTWSEFVTLFAVFYGCWETVHYKDEEHAALGLSSLTPPGELRLVANCFADRYTTADVHRDRIKWRALCDFRELVMESSGDLCTAVATSRKGELAVRLPRHVMRTLSNEESFRTLNTVNYLHVLESLMETRCVLFSELHPIQVDTCVLPSTSPNLLLTVGAR